MQLLLNSGLDIHTSDIDSMTLLYLLIRQANVAMVQMLLRYLYYNYLTPTPGANP
jgi:ankyrin repeat protein